MFGGEGLAKLVHDIVIIKALDRTHLCTLAGHGPY
jgi:hypothetical protein